MSDKIVEKLDEIKQAFDKQNEIIQQMLGIMPRPADKFTKVLERILFMVGILGIVHVVDILRKWILGE